MKSHRNFKVQYDQVKKIEGKPKSVHSIANL
jgi:hypothetical protein